MPHPFRELACDEAAANYGEFAEDALYTPTGGVPVSVLAMPSQSDVVAMLGGFPNHLQQTARSFNLQARQVPARPHKGDTITTLDENGEPFEVFTLVEVASRKDRLGVEWICIVGEPTAPEPVDPGEPVTATADIILFPARVAGVGRSKVRATAAIHLADATAAGAVTVVDADTITASADIHLANATAAGAAHVRAAAAADIHAAAATAAGAAHARVSGSGAVHLADAIAAGAASAVSPGAIEATADIHLANATAAATAVVKVKAAAAVQAGNATAAGAAKARASGAASVQLAGASIAGAGKAKASGAAAIVSANAIAAAIATVKAKGSAAITSALATASGAGKVKASGAAAITLGAAVAAAAAKAKANGTAAITLAPAIAAGAAAQAGSSAVTIDTTFEATIAAGSGTTSVTVASQSNRLMLFGLYFDSAADGSTPSSVTFNGVACTRVTGFETHDGVQIHMYKLLAPATGSHTLSITGPTGADVCLVKGVVVYNADQTTPLGTADANGATGTIDASATSSVTGFTNGLSFGWWGCWNNGNTTVAASEDGTGQTIVGARQNHLGDNFSMSKMAGGATNAFGWSLTAGGGGACFDTSAMAVGVKPA